MQPSKILARRKKGLLEDDRHRRPFDVSAGNCLSAVCCQCGIDFQGCAAGRAHDCVFQPIVDGISG
jgi:hypothetical protein